MLADIETEIVDLLSASLTGVNRVSIDKAHSELALNVPVVNVIVGGGAFTRSTMSQFKLAAQVYIIVSFKNLRSEADRRKGVYPILEAIMGLLIGQQLDLAITPLVPKRLDNITDEKEAQEGKLVFQIEFETGFVVGPLEEADADDLLKVGLSYYLQDPADDNKADGADLIDLEEE